MYEAARSQEQDDEERRYLARAVIDASGTVSTLLTSGTPQNLNKIGMDWAKFIADPFAAQAERLWKNTPQVGPSTLPMLLATMESMPP